MTERERLVRIIGNCKIFERCGCHYNDVERYINELSDCLLENGVIVPPVNLQVRNICNKRRSEKSIKKGEL